MSVRIPIDIYIYIEKKINNTPNDCMKYEKNHAEIETKSDRCHASINNKR